MAYNMMELSNCAFFFFNIKLIGFLPFCGADLYCCSRKIPFAGYLIFYLQQSSFMSEFDTQVPSAFGKVLFF